MTEETLFHEALAKPSGARAAFLDPACAGQPELRAAALALLAAHEASGSLLDKPPVGLAQTMDSEPAQPEQTPPRPANTRDYRPDVQPGLVIAGRYTLQQKIGEGGMGEVWVAKQTEPVKRKVALKLIKTGTDSRAVLQRFEQERQALAMTASAPASRPARRQSATGPALALATAPRRRRPRLQRQDRDNLDARARRARWAKGFAFDERQRDQLGDAYRHSLERAARPSDATLVLGLAGAAAARRFGTVGRTEFSLFDEWRNVYDGSEIPGGHIGAEKGGLRVALHLPHRAQTLTKP